MSNETQHTPADVRGRIIRASILPIEDEETMIAGLRAGAEAVERGELDAEDFAGIWSQYLRELFRRASSVPAPADVRERIKAAIREGVRYVAKADGAYLYEPSVDETADRILSLLRTPRGEGEAAAMSANLARALAAMQAAWIEWRRGRGADAAMEWIENTLIGPGLIPGDDESDAQAFFDRAVAEIENHQIRHAAALRSEAQGEDRWEDLVFGPIVQAHNEAQAARRGEGGGDGD